MSPSRSRVPLARPRSTRSGTYRGSGKLLFAALLVPLAFWLGRRSAALDVSSPARDPASPAAPGRGGLHPTLTATSAVERGAPKLVPLTSTIALCPCPAGKTPAVGSKPAPAIKRKHAAPVEIGHERSDPTARTSEYLRDRVRDLAPCAPKSPGEVRVHIEVTVSPRGKVDRVRVTNMDPLPPAINDCVEAAVQRFEPPPFDGTTPETFALTVVL